MTQSHFWMLCCAAAAVPSCRILPARYCDCVDEHNTISMKDGAGAGDRDARQINSPRITTRAKLMGRRSSERGAESMVLCYASRRLPKTDVTMDSFYESGTMDLVQARLNHGRVADRRKTCGGRTKYVTCHGHIVTCHGRIVTCLGQVDHRTGTPEVHGST